MAKVGRPAKFSPELGTRICERIADGESLVRICMGDDYPTPQTVRSWLRKGIAANDKGDEYALFLANYARAREDQADSYADQITDLANNAVTCQDRTVIEGMRVAIDALKWAAGKRKPKVYGEKVSTEITGEGGSPLRVIVEMPPE